MAPEKKLSRQRCTICRSSYRPDPRAQLTQKTCSAQCRRKRRQRAAKRRRSKNLEAYRSAERKRQQRQRSRARTANAKNVTRAKAQPARDAAQPARDPGRLSRAGLDPQLSRLIEKIIDSVDKQLRVSRADFERELLEIIEENGQFVGQVRQKRADVTPPAYFSNPLKSKEKQAQNWDEMSRAGIDSELLERHGEVDGTRRHGSDTAL